MEGNGGCDEGNRCYMKGNGGCEEGNRDCVKGNRGCVGEQRLREGEWRL